MNIQTSTRRRLAAAGFGLSALFADTSALAQEPFLGPYQRTMLSEAMDNVPSQEVVFYNRVLRTIRTEHFSKERVDEAEDLIVRNRKALAANNITLSDALNGVLKKLDPHSSFVMVKDLLNGPIQNAGWDAAGIDLRLEQNGALVYGTSYKGPARKMGLKDGDMILAVNGADLAGRDAYGTASLMCGPQRSQLQLEVERKGSAMMIDVSCDFSRAHSVYTNVIERNIGYIRLNNFDENSYDDFHAALAEMEDSPNQTITSYILDLRNNFGGLVDSAYGVIDDFIDSNKPIVRTKTRYGDEPKRANYGDVIKGKPLIVLVNDSSFSASEMVALVLQHFKRATVMGMDSGGKGSVQTRTQLDERGLAIMRPGDNAAAILTLTTGLYMAPDGQSPQKRGVSVDVQVNDTYKLKYPPKLEQDRENAIENPQGAIPFMDRMHVNACNPDASIQQWLSYLKSPNGAPDLTLMCAVNQLIPKVLVPKSVRTVPVAGAPRVMGLRASIAQP